MVDKKIIPGTRQLTDTPPLSRQINPDMSTRTEDQTDADDTYKTGFMIDTTGAREGGAKLRFIANIGKVKVRPHDRMEDEKSKNKETNVDD